MKRFLNLLWRELIHGGHLQSLGVVGITYVSSFLLGINADWKILSLAYLIFYPIYINDRFKWIELDETTNPERTKHIKNYLWLGPKIILFSILLLITLLINIGNLKLTGLSLTILFLGFLYPIYFKNLTKKIFAFKNFYVAFFFATMAILPALYEMQPLANALLISFVIFVFLKTILMQILLDCKDVEEDRVIGLLTVPALIGKEKTIKFLTVANTLVIISFLFLTGTLINSFPWQMVILLLLIPFNFFSYSLAKKQNYYGYILAGGEFMLWPLLIAMIKFISSIS
ncbi:MAG: UbiA family prenyltransferase [Candidatus Paceibacterota bacterium]|jgi:4-hydroxybenzoate polyprenyltransferase